MGQINLSTLISFFLLALPVLATWASPGSLPYIGILAGLLCTIPKQQIQEKSRELLTSCLTLLLLEKIQTFHHGLGETIPIKPIHLLMAVWALQAIKNKTPLKEIYKNPGTWILSLFTLSTILTENLNILPWHWNNTQKDWEAMILGLMLLATPVKSPSILWTIILACIWTLITAKIPDFHWVGTQLFVAKNPGCALSTIAVAFLLARGGKINLGVAGILTVLIGWNLSLGSLTIALILWAIYILHKVHSQISKPLKTRFVILSLSLLLLAILCYPKLIAYAGRDLSGTGRVPSILHLLINWVPQSPTIGFGAEFRQVYRKPDGPSQVNLGMLGPLTEALYLRNLKRQATCNNAYVEAAIHYGIPTLTLLLLGIITLTLHSDHSRTGKCLILLALLVIPAYSAMPPFSWKEMGLIWILPSLLPNKTQKRLSRELSKKLLLTSTLLSITLTFYLFQKQNHWREVWFTPLTVTLNKMEPIQPDNLGCHIPSQDILATSKKIQTTSTLIRPYLSNLILVLSKDEKTAEKDRLQLENQTKIPIKAGFKRAHTQPLWHLLLLGATPLLLTTIFIFSKKFTTAQQPLVLGVSLILALLFLPTQKKSWNMQTLTIKFPPPTSNIPWIKIWEKEIKKTAFGEALQEALATRGHPAEFRYPKREILELPKQTRRIHYTLLTTASNEEIEKAKTEAFAFLNMTIKNQDEIDKNAGDKENLRNKEQKTNKSK